MAKRKKPRSNVARAGAQPSSQTAPQAGAQASVQAGVQATAQVKPQAKPQASVQAKPQAKPQASASAKSQAAAQTKPQAAAQTKPQAAAQTKSQVSVQAKPQSKEQVKAAEKPSKPAEKSPKNPNKKPNVFRRLLTYFHNVRLEIKRTTWPTRSEVLNMSIIVVIALLFFGVLILALDQIMVVFINWLSQFKLGSNASLVINGADQLSWLANLLSTGGR